MDNINVGLLLMAVGMSTVFIILLIVINLGKILISLVNKYAPEEVIQKKTKPIATTASTIPNQTIAAIVAAISVTSGGKARVTKIEQ